MIRVDDPITTPGRPEPGRVDGDAPATVKPLRVLHLAAGNMFGGIETFLLTLARCSGLEPSMESEFGVCFPGRFRDELKATERPVHDLGSVRLSRPWTMWRARRRLHKLLLARRPDRVVVHSPWARIIFGPVVRRLRIPLVLYVHGPMTSSSWLDRWAGRVMVEAAILNSEHMLRECKQYLSGISQTVCRYPVEAKEGACMSRTELRQALGTQAGAVVIVQVSRMEPWKGHRQLIQALTRLRDLPNWECWIVGGPQRPDEVDYDSELKAIAAASGCGERIKFLGQRSDVQSLLGAADVFCQPNIGAEPFGIVFIEALNAGLFVATSAFGGGAEIVSLGCGSLTTPGDIKALSEALGKAIVEPNLRQSAAVCGPRRAAELCDPRAQMHRLYEALSNFKV